MATPVFACGFECGGGHLTTVGTTSYSTTTVRSGLRSGRINPSAYIGKFSNSAVTGAAVRVGRVYVYFATLPNALVHIFGFGTGGNGDFGVYFKSTDNSLYTGNGTTFSSSGISVTTGQWYLLEYREDNTDNLLDARVNDVAIPQLSIAIASNPSGITCGWGFGNATADLFFDDLLVSSTSADYPLGAGYVLSYIPNADGTHTTNGANDVERTLTGTDIVIATTTAYQLVDDRPLESVETDFINIKVAITDYVEIAYEDSVEPVAPRSVEAIVGYHDAGGAGTHNFVVTLRDNTGGTTADIMAAATRNVGATMSFGRAHFTTIPGGGAWTLGAFNALRSRINASDASPDVYIDGLMLEAEYAPLSSNPNSLGEPGLHAIGRGAVAAHNPAVRLGGWLEYH